MKLNQYHILIINLVKERSTVKSKVLSRAASKFWHGWKSPDFVRASQDIQRAMEELIRAGIIEFIPTKPLRVLKEIKIG